MLPLAPCCGLLNLGTLYAVGFEPNLKRTVTRRSCRRAAAKRASSSGARAALAAL